MRPPAATPHQAPRRSYTQLVMGLPFSLHLRGPARPVEERAVVQSIWASLRDADRIFSPYSASSDISRIARGELTIADADPTVAEVLALADRARVETSGCFDVRYAGRLDPSGIVKGWAAARAAALIDLPDADYYLNAGGDVLLAAPATGATWRVGIEDPADPARLLRVLEVSDGAVATSGSAHRGAHILDPATGSPATGVLQATVVGPDLVRADVFATALVAGGGCERFPLPTGYRSILVTDGGRVLG